MELQKARRFLFGLAICTLIAACGMHEEKKKKDLPNQVTTQTPTPTPSPSTTPVAESKATFTWIKANVIDISCVRCHSAGGKASDYPFTSYEEIKNSGTIDETPEKSAFYTLIDTAKMPPKLPRLNEELVRAVYEWIKTGAQNN